MAKRQWDLGLKRKIPMPNAYFHQFYVIGNGFWVGFGPKPIAYDIKLTEIGIRHWVLGLRQWVLVKK